MVVPASLSETTMKSTTTLPVTVQAPVQAPATTEYTHTLGNHTSHVWNIRSSSAAATAPVISPAIAEFYRYEDMSAANTGEFGHTRLEKSFPRHRALVMASLGSSRDLIARNIGSSSPSLADVCRKRYTTATAETARARAHDIRCVTPFTDLSAYQKHHLLSQSALTGLLIVRFTGVRSARYNTIKSAKTHAELTAKHIHSALACEFLVGARYYRDLPRYVASLYSGSGNKNVVGSDKTNIMAQFTPADVSPESVAATKTELLKTYTAQIDRLVGMVKQYKRGLVSLEAIRTDPEFTRMMCAFWRYSNQLMKLKNDFEHGIDAQIRSGECSDRIDTRRFFLVADICAALVMVPQLYNYEIAHLFDNTGQSYAKYIKAAKNTSVRLSNDGLTAAFLSFTAIEPRMLTAEMAPKHGMKYQTTTMSSCANHIPSRHPLFGALRAKHLHHIPRTADAIVASSERTLTPACTPQIGIPRSLARYDDGYTPLQDELDDIRTGRPQPNEPIWSRINQGKVIQLVKAREELEATEAARSRRRGRALYDDITDDEYYYSDDSDNDGE